MLLICNVTCSQLLDSIFVQLRIIVLFENLQINWADKKLQSVATVNKFLLSQINLAILTEK